MEPIINNLFELTDFSAGGILSKSLIKTDKVDHTLFCLAKGTDISEHTTTKEASVTVLKGKGAFFLGEKAVPMEAGTFIFMPANQPHSLRADEDLIMLLSLVG